MLNRIFIAAVIVFLGAQASPSPVRAQQSKDSQLIFRVEKPCSGWECAQEIFLFWPRELRDGNGMVFVRVCSEQTLLPAIANAAMSPMEIANWVQYYYHFKSDQIAFVRDNQCNPKSPTIIPTEAWWARTIESGPKWVDGTKGDKCNARRLGKSSEQSLPFEGPINYRAAVRELIGELKLHPKAFGVVAGYYLDKPTRKMTQATGVSRQLLKESGISSERYQASIKYWPGDWKMAPPDPKPNRPTIILFDIDGEIERSAFRASGVNHSN